MLRQATTDLAIDTVQFTVTQNVTPTINLQLSGFGSVLDGFASSSVLRRRLVDPARQQEIEAILARASAEIEEALRKGEHDG